MPSSVRAHRWPSGPCFKKAIRDVGEEEEEEEAKKEEEEEEEEEAEEKQEGMTTSPRLPLPTLTTLRSRVQTLSRTTTLLLATAASSIPKIAK